jgi:hypothetical protein
VNEFAELADWFGWRAPRVSVVVDSLPTAAFRVKNRQYVSFSTNNYLGVATRSLGYLRGAPILWQDQEEPGEVWRPAK